jgi:hypothetical protein
MVKALGAIIFGLSLVAPVSAAAPPVPSKAATQPKPDWSELTQAQRAVLAPLKDEWGKLDTLRRTKWVKVANNYPKMKPEQQARLQAQMKSWAELTPEQRRVAREKYKSIKKLPPAQREHVKAQWQQYQQSLAPKPDTNTEEAASTTPPQ